MSDELKGSDVQWIKGLGVSVKTPVRLSETIRSSPFPSSDIVTFQRALAARPTGDWERPDNFREISEKEFAQSLFFSENPVATEVRIFPLREGETPSCFTLSYMVDGTGFTMHRDYWAGKIRFFTFGCAHSWGPVPSDHPSRSFRLGQCERVMYCTKCEYWHVVDSSD
jgi:hypothetical protein